jgi:hypothetical protein
MMELVECCGGTCDSNAITCKINAILVSDWKPLKCIVNELCVLIKSSRGLRRRWSIEKIDDTVATKDIFYHPNHSEGELCLPLLRGIWLVDSICADYLLDLNKNYCCGVLHLH